VQGETIVVPGGLRCWTEPKVAVPPARWKTDNRMGQRDGKTGLYVGRQGTGCSEFSQLKMRIRPESVKPSQNLHQAWYPRSL